MPKDISISHIFSQLQEHDEAVIIGNREALTQIRDTIDNLLNSSVQSVDVATSHTTLTTSDGEGFDLHIALLDKNWQSKEWQSLTLPYTDNLANQISNQNKNLTPYQLLNKFKK